MTPTENEPVELKALLSELDGYIALRAEQNGDRDWPYGDKLIRVCRDRLVALTLIAERTCKESLQVADSGDAGVVAWLVEFGPTGKRYDGGKYIGPATPTQYYCGRHGDNGRVTSRTSDPNEAMRFSRKEDAEALILLLQQKDFAPTAVKATEHVWMEARPTPAHFAGTAVEAPDEATVARWNEAWRRFFYPANSDFLPGCMCKIDRLELPDSLREVMQHYGIWNAAYSREQAADDASPRPLPGVDAGVRERLVASLREVGNMMPEGGDHDALIEMFASLANEAAAALGGPATMREEG